MEPTDDPKLRKLLHEWEVEKAPCWLDERVLGERRPWWTSLLRGSVRVPIPIALACAVLLVWMTAALVRPRPASPPGDSEFQPVRDAQVRIIRSAHADR